MNSSHIPLLYIIAQHDGNITKWHEAYFQKPRPYFTNEGFPNPSCPDGTNRFFSKQEVYVIGADNTCVLQDNKDKFCNGPLKPRKQYLYVFHIFRGKTKDFFVVFIIKAVFLNIYIIQISCV